MGLRGIRQMSVKRGTETFGETAYFHLECQYEGECNTLLYCIGT